MIKSKPSFWFLAGLSVVTALNIGLFGVETAQAGCGWLDITCKDSGIRQTGRDIDPTNPKSDTRRILRENDPTSPEFAENQWGNAGGAGYPAAAQWMRANNAGSQGWDENQKKYLRPHFGSLLDQVAVIYNANLIDEWSAAGYKIQQTESDGQTFCNRIYLNDPYQPNDSDQLVLLAHELTHSKQCQQLGGEGKFGFHYFREYKRAGQNYENNKLEKEAYAFGNYFAGWYEEQIANSQTLSSVDDPLVFDARFYLDRYPDLKAAYGTNYQAATQHWLTQGLPVEGRAGSAVFDARFYLDKYPDLKAAYGTNYQAATQHWLTQGLPVEGRAGSAE
jgi:hypothetical protein